MRIGIIKEGKVPVDHRSPLTPGQAKEITEKFDVEIVVQSSDVRIFKDEEYVSMGIPIVESLEDCDIILGVKEVPLDMLIDKKTFLFFSHTIKEQAYNRELLKTVLAKNIRLIDYEPITNANGIRVIAFGRWAGIVGAYNAILTFGKRYNLFNLRPAHECYDLEDLRTEFNKVALPKMKIVVTGGGRVAKGAIEVLNGMGIRKVTPAAFIEERFDEVVFTQLNTRDYNKHRQGQPFNRHEFYAHPEHYIGDFLKYSQHADLLIACAFWDPAAPVLFTRDDIMDPHFKIRVIGDITCDIDGSIPSTKQASTIDKPIYDYNPSEDLIEQPLSEEANITVMAVDNLPCELPRDASESFGREMINHVIPRLVGQDDGMIEKATITKDGKLTRPFAYLKGYVEGK